MSACKKERGETISDLKNSIVNLENKHMMGGNFAQIRMERN